jgi:hypothetical protein
MSSPPLLSDRHRWLSAGVPSHARSLQHPPAITQWPCLDSQARELCHGRPHAPPSLTRAIAWAGTPAPAPTPRSRQALGLQAEEAAKDTASGYSIDVLVAVRPPAAGGGGEDGSDSAGGDDADSVAVRRRVALEVDARGGYGGRRRPPVHVRLKRMHLARLGCTVAVVGHAAWCQVCTLPGCPPSPTPLALAFCSSCSAFFFPIPFRPLRSPVAHRLGATRLVGLEVGLWTRDYCRLALALPRR